MAKTRFIQNSFLSGELSPLVSGNITLQQYYQGLEIGSNVVIVPQGGAKRRGGLAYVFEPLKEYVRDTTSATMPNGGSAAFINDDDDSTTATTTTPIGTVLDYVVCEIDLGQVITDGFVKAYGLSLSVGAPSNSFKIQVSTDAVAWSEAFRWGGINNENAYDYVSFNFRYVRLVRVGTEDFGAAVATLSTFDVIRPTGLTTDVKTFELATEFGETYLGVLTTRNLGIYQAFGDDYAPIQWLPVPYAPQDVPSVRAASLGSVTLFFHENYPVMRVINYGGSGVGGAISKNPGSSSSSVYWYIDEAPILNIPQFDFNDNVSPSPVSEVQDVVFATFTAGMKYQIDVEGVFSKNITFAGDATADERDSTAFNMQKNLQEMPVFGDTGVSVARTGALTYRITISGESAKDYQLFSGFNVTGSTSATMTFTKIASGTARKEPIWSEARGYPRMGEFFQGRLWIGGTRDKRQTLLASKSGQYLDFDEGQGDDSDAIFATLTSQGQNEFTDIYGGRNLQIFTKSAEYAVLSSLTTPATIDIRLQTSNGSIAIDAQESDGAVVYADKNGKTVREYVYSFNEDAYVSTDITVLSSHLIKTPVSMGFLTGTSSDDANWLFIVNSDGTVSILNKLRAQDINGFVPMTTDGFIESVTIVNELSQALFVVKRTLNGVESRFVERWDFDYKMDLSSQRTIGATSFNVGAIYNGETVRVVVGDTVLPDREISSGNITLTAEEYARHSGETIEVGFNFIPTIKPMPVNTSIGSGDNVMRLKKAVRMNIRVNETAGLYADGVPIASRGFGSDTLDAPPVRFSGILDDIYPLGGWSRDVMPTITCPDPTAMHVQTLELEVESS